MEWNEQVAGMKPITAGMEPSGKVRTLQFKPSEVTTFYRQPGALGCRILRAQASSLLRIAARTAMFPGLLKTNSNSEVRYSAITTQFPPLSTALFNATSSFWNNSS